MSEEHRAWLTENERMAPRPSSRGYHLTVACTLCIALVGVLTLAATTWLPAGDPAWAAPLSPPHVNQAAAPSPATVAASDIVTDTTWRMADSPFQVTANIAVMPGATLMVEPGVEVRFDQSRILSVNGKLIAIGTPSQPITFTGTTQQPGWWDSIRVEGSSSSPVSGTAFSYVTVEYGGRSNGNLYLAYATVSIANSTIRNSGKDGIYAGPGGVPNVADTAFTGNQGYPVNLTDGSVNAVLSGLTATGNGDDALALGQGTLNGAHIWGDGGISKYVVNGSIDVPRDASLTVQPGTSVRFAQIRRLNVGGKLTALGTSSRPITFTGTVQQPGWWDGIQVAGTSSSPAAAALDFVTLDYGGRLNANLHVSNGQAAVSHSTIRHSSQDGVYAAGGAMGTFIESSQVVSNTGYAVRSKDNMLLAANNWWGSNSGPTVVGSDCNPDGTGSQVSANVAFWPFLTSADGDPGPLAPGGAPILSLMPERWFVPADGVIRAWVTISMRDGDGQPVSGRRVRLQSSLGAVVDGALTDAKGESRAYVTSTTAGDAELTGLLDVQSACELARSASATITFTPAGAGNELLPGEAAPYLNGGIQIEPEPITRGVPTKLRARLKNPNSFAISANGTFGVAGSGLGLAFGPVGDVENKIIPANGEEVVEVIWTPTFSGHYCVQFEYSYRPASGGAGVGTADHFDQGDFKTQRNVNVRPGPFLSPSAKNSLDKARFATDGMGDGGFVLDNFDGPNPGSLLQGQMVGNILDFIYDNGNAIACALGGGDDCKGWDGPKLKIPFTDTYGNLKEDPPRQDYTILASADTIAFDPLQPGPDMPASRTAALNELTEASLDLAVNLMAAVISYDRYGGAAEANDLHWSSMQAGAYLFFLKESGQAFITVADKIDALIQELHNEGWQDVIVTADDYRAYQDRLRTQGFSAQELEAARLVGLTDQGIEAARQKRLALNPDTMAGSHMDAWATASASYRELGNFIVAPPAFGGIGIGGAPGGQSMAAGQTAPQLARIFPVDYPIRVGNPLTQTATIDLRIRRLDVPADWIVTAAPATVTLAAGTQTTVTVTVQPGTAAVQGTQPRLALEGYAGGELLGGVVLDVMVPRNMPFDGKVRVFTPLLSRSFQGGW